MYRYGNRDQLTMLPQSIEEYVNKKDPVRAYDAFIEAIDLERLGIYLDEKKIGNPEYNPKTMLKLLIYGASYGWLSSRKLERAINHNVSFIWLLEGLKPDHKTISEFRRKHKEALRELLKESVRLCRRLDLIEGNILFVDGSKIRANAGRDKSYSKEQYKKREKSIDRRIDEILEECDRLDEEEAGLGSLIEMNEELADKNKLKERIKEIIKEFDKQGKSSKKINLTDPDAFLMRSRQGTQASYNIQSVVDDKHGLIVNMDAVKENNDRKQFFNQINQSKIMLGKACKVACADAGYSNIEELSKVEEQKISVIVPSQEQVYKDKQKVSWKEKFIYDSSKDNYLCPGGYELKYYGELKTTGRRTYKIENKQLCLRCQHYGKCTKNKAGRSIYRSAKEDIKDKIAQQYDNAQGREIYKRRKSRVEHPFGHIKHNLGMRHFLLRGIEGIRAEISVAGTCFNIIRMITLLGGVEAFRTSLQNLKL